MKVSGRADYCEDLSLLLRYGMPLAEACDLLASETAPGSPEARIASGVKSGNPLHHAMLSSGLAEWALAAIEATENAGRPADGLDLAARVLRDHRLWQDRMIRLTAYPLLVLGSTILVGLILFRTILPTISALSEELGSQPPWATRIALSLGRAAGSPVAWIVALGSLGYAVTLASDQRRARAAATLIPVTADIVRLDESRCYFGVLGALLSSSIPADRAMEMASRVVIPAPWRSDAVELARRVRAGDSPSEAARGVRWFPSRAARVLAVAEATGTMSQACASLADYSERALARRLDAMARWVPPILLAVATVLIAFLAQALLMPAFGVDLPL